LNDWEYLRKQYASSPVLDRSYSTRPVLIWNGTKEYPVEWLKAVSSQFRDTFFIVGGESWATWSKERAQYLDGNTYYWSSQNPYTNPSSFDQLKTLAQMVRDAPPNPDGSPKRWFAPFTPGYNHILGGGTSCVPRNGAETMQLLFTGNGATNPDSWVFISWNEISEGTYVEPLQRWGEYYLTKLKELITG
jgi:hypothetical protein